MEELLALLEEPQPSVQLEKKVNHISKIPKTSCELRMNSYICDYDMDFIILDLGSDVNILTIKTWEIMGKPRLVWSPLHLCLSN